MGGKSDMSLDLLPGIFQFHLIVKAFLLALALFYIILTIVIYRQISLMTQTLNSSISPVIRSVALGQVIAVGVFFLLVAIFA